MFLHKRVSSMSIAQPTLNRSSMDSTDLGLYAVTVFCLGLQLDCDERADFWCSPGSIGVLAFRRCRCDYDDLGAVKRLSIELSAEGSLSLRWTRRALVLHELHPVLLRSGLSSVRAFGRCVFNRLCLQRISGTCPLPATPERTHSYRWFSWRLQALR